MAADRPRRLLHLWAEKQTELCTKSRLKTRRHDGWRVLQRELETKFPCRSNRARANDANDATSWRSIQSVRSAFFSPLIGCYRSVSPPSSSKGSIDRGDNRFLLVGTSVRPSVGRISRQTGRLTQFKCLSLTNSTFLRYFKGSLQFKTNLCVLGH